MTRRGRVRRASLCDCPGQGFGIHPTDKDGSIGAIGLDYREKVVGRDPGCGRDDHLGKADIASQREIHGGRVVRARNDVGEKERRTGVIAQQGSNRCGRMMHLGRHPGVGGGDHDPGHPESHDGRLEGSRLPLPCRQDPLREIPRHRRPRGEPRSQSRQLIQQKGPEGEELREGVLGDTAQEGRGSQVQLLTIRVIEIKDITVNI